MNAGANQDGKELIAQNVSHIGIAFTELVKILGNVFVKTGLKVKTVMLLKILTEIGVNGVLGVIVLVKENKLEKGTLKDLDDFVEYAISRKKIFFKAMRRSKTRRRWSILQTQFQRNGKLLS